MNRFTEQVQVQPQDTTTGFVGGQLSVLNKLQQFNQSTERLINVKETQRGLSEASGKSDISQKREVGGVESFLTGGVATKAYNKSIETAYLAGIANDTREAIAGIESENATDINAFNEKVNGYVSGILKSVDPSVRDSVSEFASNQITNSRIRVHSATIKNNKNKAAAESAAAVEGFSNESARLAREGNKVGAAEAIQSSFKIIDGMLEADDINAQQATKMKREIEREASEQSIRLEFDNLINDSGVDSAFNELEKIENNPARGWTPDEWDAFVRSEKADLRSKIIQSQQVSADVKLASAREVSNLKIKASTGMDLNGNPVEPSNIIGEAERLFSQGKLSGNERASILTGVIEDQKEAMKKAEIKQRVSDRMGGQNEIALTQKEVDMVWDEDIAPILSQAPPVLRSADVANFVNSTKIVPTSVVKQVNNDLNSGDPALVSEAADLMDRLDSVSGIPDKNFSPSDRAFAEVVVALQQNMEPNEAIKLARQNTNPNDKGRIEAREGIIKEQKFALDYSNIVADSFDPWFGSTTVNDVSKGQMTKEYSVLFEEHFKAGMSKGAAEQKSLQIIKRNWGDTNATKKTQVIKYPPENYYAVNGSVEYIQRDLYKSISLGNIGLGEFKSSDIMLISDSVTAREASMGKPTYMVMIDYGENGLFPLVGFRYTPNMDEQIQKVTSENKSISDEVRGNAVTESEQQQAIKNLFEKNL